MSRLTSADFFLLSFTPYSCGVLALLLALFGKDTEYVQLVFFSLERQAKSQSRANLEVYL